MWDPSNFLQPWISPVARHWHSVYISQLLCSELQTNDSTCPSSSPHTAPAQLPQSGFPPCFCMNWRSCSCQNLGVLSDTSITPHLLYYRVLKHLLPNIFPVELVMLWPLLPPQSWSLLPLVQVTATVSVDLKSHQSILHTVAGITFLKWKLHHDALPVQNS